jgi:hypothetical protein
VGTPDAFVSSNFSTPVFVDGITLTYGDPREHIWTFAAADNVSKCPCSGGSPAPPEVRSDYSCDARVLWYGNCQIDSGSMLRSSMRVCTQMNVTKKMYGFKSCLTVPDCHELLT